MLNDNRAVHSRRGDSTRRTQRCCQRRGRTGSGGTEIHLAIRTPRPPNMCIIDEMVLRVVGGADGDEQIAVR